MLTLSSHNPRRIWRLSIPIACLVIGSFGCGIGSTTLSLPVNGLSGGGSGGGSGSPTDCAPTNSCSVSFAWNASTSPSVTGYMIFWGTASGQYTSSEDVGNSLTGTVSGLGAGTYYFAVLAYTNTMPLAWSPTSGASGYQIQYGVSGSPDQITLDVGNVLSYNLSGLDPTQTYSAVLIPYTTSGDVETPMGSQYNTNFSNAYELESAFSNEVSTGFSDPMVMLRSTGRAKVTQEIAYTIKK